MTAKEKTKVLKAIDLLMGDECQMLEAMTLLGSMVGIRPTAAFLLEGGLKSMDIRTLAAAPNRAFSYTPPKE